DQPYGMAAGDRRGLEEIGDGKQALTAWRHVLDLAADDAEAKTAIERL
ncbi:MAG: hypothetical protein JWO33_2990, partial [Caulobacteraceae bacterium]|nr:hypothetical protein [Caulobacteraceae bacterium]